MVAQYLLRNFLSAQTSEGATVKNMDLLLHCFLMTPAERLLQHLLLLWMPLAVLQTLPGPVT